MRWMPRRQEAMKDVVVCDKLRGADKQALIRGFPNGGTHCVSSILTRIHTVSEAIPGELKHLSTRRKRNQPRFP